MKMKMPLCEGCKRELKLSAIGFTGCDWNCEAGENTGYDYQIALECECGRIYPIGMIKNEKDFSPMKDVKIANS
jgi:hypothetical protein